MDALSLLASFLGALLPFIGALYIFWQRVEEDRRLAHRRRELEDRRTQDALDRERDGLLRLVNIDVSLNIDKLELIDEMPHMSERYRAYSELYKTHWLDARVRLAQILPTEGINTFAKYYGSIYEIEANSGDEGSPPEEVDDPTVRDARLKARGSRRGVLSAHARSALEVGEEIRQLSADYMGVSPSYFDLHTESDRLESGAQS